MPIPKSDFEKGKKSDGGTEKIVQLLVKDRGRAYNAREIAAGIGHPSSNEPALGADGKAEPAAVVNAYLARVDLRNLLDETVGRRLVERRFIESNDSGEWYYLAAV